MIFADSNGNGSPELAVVGNQACCSSSALVAISDALTGAPLRQQFLPRPEYGARVSLAALPDSDGNGLPELAAVAPNEWGAAPGTRALLTDQYRFDEVYEEALIQPGRDLGDTLTNSVERYGVQGDYVPNGFWKQVKFPFVWKG